MLVYECISRVVVVKFMQRVVSVSICSEIEAVVKSKRGLVCGLGRVVIRWLVRAEDRSIELTETSVMILANIGRCF